MTLNPTPTRLFGAGTALACVLLTASPALAQNRMTVNPAANQGWTQEAPTSYLNTEMAQVIPGGLQYVSAGAGAGAFPLLYSRGLGNGCQLDFGLGATFGTGATTPATGAFAANLGAFVKQQLLRGNGMAISVLGGGTVSGLGGTPGLGVQGGIPMTWDIGRAYFTVYPNISLPGLTSGAGFAGDAEVTLGLQTPLANYWSLLLDISPNITFGGAGSAFSLPASVGARLSPNATSHVDFTLGTVGITPAFGLTAGLVGVTGHVGFF